ncbi:MAG: 3-hydroxyacyl-CoA dehydrogenase NAD-binding domain-containing protein, partial [Actinomycetota bacterium]
MTELTQSVGLEREGEIALIVIDNPPVNALSHHVRQGILDGVEAARADDEVTAIVLTCRGRTFIAGADISEFGKAPQGPGLGEVQAAMESSPKPVVAAIHGNALGGGFEVAMCANYRVAVAGTNFGFPEVKLGLLPGAGGTQRLPRVVGAAKALDMVVGGDPIDAAEALELGLIDDLVDRDEAGTAEAGAIAFARRCVAEGMPLKKLRDLDDKVSADRANPEIFDQYRQKIARKTRGFLAPEYNIRCIEAAVNLDDFDAGIERERELFTELMSGTQSAAQRYYFFAEREAAKIPDVPRDTPQLSIESAGILGAGTMGGGIAMNFANAGIPVTVVERDQESLDRGLGVVRKNYERSASRGSIPAEAVEERMALITGSVDRQDFAEADIVIEAVFEDMDLKKEVFADLDRIAKPDALLASNTSALDVNVIASATTRPESVIGMHFFSPANVMKLLEVVRGDATSDQIIATTMALSKRITKIPVLSGVCHGFIGNRMLAKRRIESDRLILEGATPAQVDKVVYDFGFPMGPYAMSDLAGLDEVEVSAFQPMSRPA